MYNRCASLSLPSRQMKQLWFSPRSAWAGGEWKPGFMIGWHAGWYIVELLWPLCWESYHQEALAVEIYIRTQLVIYRWGVQYVRCVTTALFCFLLVSQHPGGKCLTCTLLCLPVWNTVLPPFSFSFPGICHLFHESFSNRSFVMLPLQPEFLQEQVLCQLISHIAWKLLQVIFIQVFVPNPSVFHRKLKSPTFKTQETLKRLSTCNNRRWGVVWHV